MLFYNINKANEYLDKLKKIKFLSLIIFLIILIVTTLLTIFTNTKIIMVFDILSYSLYFIYLDIYFGFIKKYYLARYHLLAKIAHYEHEIYKPSNIMLTKNKVTLNKIIFSEINDDNRTLFIEEHFIKYLDLNKESELDVVDNIIVGVN